MKKRNIIYTIAIALGVMMSSCDDDLAQPPMPEPEGSRIGVGTWDNPMTPWQVLIGTVNDTISTPWVSGYIVGYVNVNISSTLTEKSAVVNDPEMVCTVPTNILLASDSLETDWEKCTTVQLPNTAVRSALNLKEHPENLGRMVCLRGTTGSKYCGVYGLRSVQEYNWGDKGIRPPEPVPPVDCLFENFDSSDKISTYLGNGWKNQEVDGGLSGWYIREFDNQNYITCSAYLGTATGGPYENWLIAPPVNIDNSPSKTLTFRTQAAYQAEESTLEVFVLDKDDATKAKRVKLEAPIAAAPAKGYSSWVQSGTIDLSGFSGVIYIGWRYCSKAGGSNGSTTYCVDNVNIGGAPEN